VARARSSSGAIKIPFMDVDRLGTGAAIQLASTTIAKGQPVRLTFGEIQHAA
jgi:hypothetical protein